ncbi:hypothetical protein JM654_20585 [Microbacterium oxydans]|nr:hypothetical protein [Microbacterium oxydans]
MAVYYRGRWVFFSVMVLGDIFDAIKAWVDSRAAMAYLETVGRASSTPWLPALAVGRIGWVLSEAGPVLLAPLAWLTIAGVVFGQAIVAGSCASRVNSSAVRQHTEAIPTPWCDGCATSATSWERASGRSVAPCC